MAPADCTTLAELFAQFPDPRRARGKRHVWSDVLIGMVAAIASGQQTGTAIVDWIQEHAGTLRQHHVWQGSRTPSGSTIRRALQVLGVEPVEARMTSWARELLRHWRHQRRRLEGLAVDGKTVRGALAHGEKVHLVSVVPHRLPVVLAQVPVPDKTNEIPAARQVLAMIQLRGWVVTLDAMHTQRATLQQICAQQGHYLVEVKANQPELHQALVDWFAEAAYPEEQEQHWQTHDRGHGRDECRRLTRRVVTMDLLGWPNVAQVLRRVCQVTDLRTGITTTSTVFAITDLTASQASAADLETLWRGHWAIENRVHYVRDVTFGEDAGQIHTGHAPQALAILRNAVLSLLRILGWTNIAQALRYFAAFPRRVIRLLTTSPRLFDRRL